MIGMKIAVKLLVIQIRPGFWRSSSCEEGLYLRFRPSLNLSNDDKSEYKCKLGVIRHLIRHGHDGLAKELAMLEPTPGGRSDLEAIVIEEQALYSDIENARRSLNAYRPVKVVNAQVAMLAMAAREAKEGNWKKARHYIERANDKPFKATDSFKLNAGFDPDIQGFEDMIIDAGRYAAMSGATIQELHAWLASEQRLEYRAPLAYGMALGYQGIHPKKSMSEMLYGIKRK